jgi:hypothetical protein
LIGRAFIWTAGTFRLTGLKLRNMVHCTKEKCTR